MYWFLSVISVMELNEKILVWIPQRPIKGVSCHLLQEFEELGISGVLLNFWLTASVPPLPWRLGRPEIEFVQQLPFFKEASGLSEGPVSRVILNMPRCLWCKLMTSALMPTATKSTTQTKMLINKKVIVLITTSQMIMLALKNQYK